MRSSLQLTEGFLQPRANRDQAIQAGFCSLSPAAWALGMVSLRLRTLLSSLFRLRLCLP